ncbi:colicin release lysis protein [Klebsiella quasipneumoniae]
MSICVIILLAACQANYIRDVKGGTVAPSASSDIRTSSSQPIGLLEILSG